MGLIGAVCLMYPNAQLSIAFVSEIFPHSFSADTVSIIFSTTSIWSHITGRCSEGVKAGAAIKIM